MGGAGLLDRMTCLIGGLTSKARSCSGVCALTKGSVTITVGGSGGAGARTCQEHNLTWEGAWMKGCRENSRLVGVTNAVGVVFFGGVNNCLAFLVEVALALLIRAW